MADTANFVLGLIGGIYGIFCGLFILLTSMGLSATAPTILPSIFLLILSVLGIIGTVLARNNPKTGGIFLLIGAFGILALIVYNGQTALSLSDTSMLPPTLSGTPYIPTSLINGIIRFIVMFYLPTFILLLTAGLRSILKKE